MSRRSRAPWRQWPGCPAEVADDEDDDYEEDAHEAMVAHVLAAYHSSGCGLTDAGCGIVVTACV